MKGDVLMKKQEVLESLKKYAVREIFSPSLNGGYYSGMDKYGALLYQVSVFGKCILIYDSEIEYLNSIEHLIEKEG